MHVFLVTSLQSVWFAHWTVPGAGVSHSRSLASAVSTPLHSGNPVLMVWPMSCEANQLAETTYSLSIGLRLPVETGTALIKAEF